MSTKVADSTGYGPNFEMSMFGYIVAGLTFVLLIPLLPFILVGWVLWKLFADEDREPRRLSWQSLRF